MQNQAELGLNKTGVKMSPMDATEAVEGAMVYTNPPAGSEDALAENRIRYMRESDMVGTVPMPASLKGAFSALQEKIMNGDHTFMDKLGERIAFERTGTRLYQALLSKYQGSDDQSGFPDFETLERFCLEEKRHFEIACNVMEQIGGDFTAMTPSADVAGVAALGWVQAINDPRINFKQSLEIILQAELVDNACWEVLIELAEDVGLKSLSVDFQKCLDEEAVHLSTIKEWVRQFNINGKVEHIITQ
ncbi:MAG TPA: ferritin-like domain-containing protein [Bacteriovoracaceae bacterium]|nr:ferritin-like domain-containing protein [Bacteriovoracaceae bacterium]